MSNPHPETESVLGVAAMHRPQRGFQELMQHLATLVAGVPELDEPAMTAARLRQAQLTKPAGALGRLEELSIHLAGMTGRAMPELRRKAILIAVADHGVCAEGVSPYPQAVTAQMVGNFLAGGAAINVLARQVGARVTVIDFGVAHPLPIAHTLPLAQTLPGATRFVAASVAKGTANLAQGPAMSQAQALQAILGGAAVAQAEIDAGLDVIGLGEMGIGNTTAAAAVGCALTGLDPVALVGRGAGLDDAGLVHKIEVVRRGLAVNGLGDALDAPVARLGSTPQMSPHPGGTAFGLQALRCVGGFELGGLVGAILTAAAQRVPIVVDGYIATAAAMLAVQLAPGVRAFLIPAHRSAEPGHAHMLAWLGLEPYLALAMRLGEGSGAALGMTLIDAAWQTLGGMATFGEAGVAERVALTT